MAWLESPGPKSFCGWLVSQLRVDYNTPISSIDELSVDMWVIARYEDEFYPAQVLEVYPTVDKAKLKCLENAYGNHEAQDFEKQKYWFPYHISDIFRCPVKPSGVQIGRAFKWKY